jgi:LCP family protein required for cell wall assembly
MMIATLNTKDKSVKFTSIMRDTYVEYNGRGMKLNAVFTAGRKVKDEDGNTTYSNDAGADALISVIQELTKVELEGYAFVGFSRPSNDKYKSSTDFNSMEEIVDILGGVDIELGKSEAAYLNRTNYIYNPANRNLVAGWNHLNGDQAQGYCRIRKVVTLGGYNNDYGRTVRQRRVIRAIFDAYKSSSITTILGKTAKCLALITTNLNEDDIYELIKDVADNGIKTMDENRLPIDGSFYDSGKAGYNGITYGLVIKEVEANPINMFMFLFGDSETEAYNNYNKLEGVTPVQVPTTQASTATVSE